MQRSVNILSHTYSYSLQLTIYNVKINTTETYDLFRTVHSHTFHNLSPSTAYSVTITAVNKKKIGPPVSVNVTTQGAPGNRMYISYMYELGQVG